MSEPRNDIARELTDAELTLIQGGGVWDKVKGAGSWVKDKVTDAWNAITSPQAAASYTAMTRILHVLTGVLTLNQQSIQRAKEIVH